MFKLLIADDEGKTTVVPLVRDEVTIGRKEGNTIRLTERNVSRKHAKLRRANGAFFVSDLKSFNGVRVNGRRIDGETELKSGDQIVIGDYQLALQFEGTEQIDTGALHAAMVNTGPTTAPTLAPAENEGPTAVVSAPPPSIEPGPPARLVMVSPPSPGAEFALSRPRLRIGRAEDLEIWVNHRSISREHAELAVENGGVYIRDLASANGVRVNGVDTKQGPVKPGDVIELGQVRFRMVGAGEHFHFDAERTIQMDALPSVVPTNRMPIFVAIGIVGVALVIGVGVALSGGGPEEPRVTQIEGATTIATAGGISGAGAITPVATSPVPALPAGPALDAQIAAAVSACQISLSSGNFANAIARANEALALRPADPQATECLQSATRAEAEDGVFLAGQGALRQNDFARAVETFRQLPEGSPYLNRPEVAEASQARARELIAQARVATDPVVAAGLAQQILQLSDVDRAIVREAETISRRASAPTVVASVRPPTGGGAGGGRHPLRAVPERGTQGGAQSSGGTQASGGTHTTQAATVQASSTSVDDEARICLGNGDNACVIRLLGNGRARTARQLALLAQAQRALTGVPSSCPTISRLIDQFPSSPEAARYRPVHVAQCQGR
ncbi:MAG: FHA domain-containing protein [Deltaproteobacteria bacterium]|nr:FHA domain-containing protein [Deltaproteobacteria bacterium]